ncbi:MAG: diguanylate cyclase [Gammaproteobacteria bacterium]|nr:diguanylate cyclase [Gammaproteobacteria bacterium]
MTAITKLKTSQSIQFFEHSVALNLVQAFHRHLDLGDLLSLFYSQSAAILQAVGMRYRNAEDGVDVEFGSTGRHTTSYNLTYQDDDLGEIVFSFERRVTEDTLTTAEDLIALAMSPVKNALLYRRACLAAESVVTDLNARPEPKPQTKPAAMVRPGHDDSLVLVGIDGIAETRARDGAEWSQTLVQAVQAQIREGLREADGVYQIDDELLAVLLPHTNAERAPDVASKLRVLIAGLHLKDGAITTQLTACMGVAGTKAASTAEEVLDNARAALKRAQAEGANSVSFHESED